MANVNKVILIGRLGNQPELRHAGGSVVCELRLAVSEKWTDKAGQKQEKTDWFTAEVWGKQAEICERFLAKGREVYVEGKLGNDDWTDKDGNKRQRTKIRVDAVQFIGGQRDSDGGQQYHPGTAPLQQPAPGEDDIPF